ncbi:MAG: DUF1549 domain-containing protein [Planctomycetota bacterium]
MLPRPPMSTLFHSLRFRTENLQACVSAGFFAALMSLAFAYLATSCQGSEEDIQLFRAAAAVFQEKCLSCHNNIDRQGDLSLETADEVFSSGFVEKGSASNSILLAAISHQDDGGSKGRSPSMPKNAAPLKPSEVEHVRKWIDAEATWPKNESLKAPTVDNFDWWSYKPLQGVNVPAIESSWIRNPIDAFILAKHQELGLEHAARANRRELIRRLSYNLTGLPPTPEQTENFVLDSSRASYNKLVDQLLASDQYGERWARHWLDVVKYADTCGYDKDKLRPNAWPYRDYVIRSFNEDKPYSQFLREQIAGDVLYQGSPDGILGLGFNAEGPWDFIGHVEVPESKIDGKVARNLDRDDMVSNAMNTFCSITVQCARCHNHKFDPITQQDYYGLQTIFAAVDRAERIYDLDPKAEQAKRITEEKLAVAERELKAIEQEIDAAGGKELKKLREKIQSLAPSIQIEKSAILF